MPPAAIFSAVNSPPSSLARSRMELSSTPKALPTLSPTPSSITSMCRVSPVRIRTVHRVAFACLDTLVNASQRMRYAPTSTSGGSEGNDGGTSRAISMPCPPMVFR